MKSRFHERLTLGPVVQTLENVGNLTNSDFIPAAVDGSYLGNTSLLTRGFMGVPLMYASGIEPDQVI